jgi:hypothetical protein
VTLDLRPQRNALQSHAMRIGRFERVGAHEAPDAPGRGLHAQILLAPIEPAQRASGLSATTARVQWLVRLMCSMDREPKDDIDLDLGEAADDLMTAYSGDFDLNVSSVRHIDLIGTYGTPMRAVPGYLEIPANSTVNRILDVTVPVIVNDAWSQSP